MDGEDLFRDGKPRRAISLGCGSGGREIAWAKDRVFESLLGVDLTPQCISAAQETARQEGVSDLVSFAVQDISGALLGDQKYDVILFEHSLHHFSDMPALLDRVAASPNPGGLLYIDEYVGPCRLQYTKKQLAFANAALQLIPEAFRVDYSGRWRKDKVLSSGPLMMYLSDPSEAVESDRILPELRKRFDVLVEKNVGGTIFPQVIQDIACNFLDDPIAINALSRILEMEADLIVHGWLESDYVCIVASPKAQNSAYASYSSFNDGVRSESGKRSGCPMSGFSDMGFGQANNLYANMRIPLSAGRRPRQSVRDQVLEIRASTS